MNRTGIIAPALMAALLAGCGSVANGPSPSPTPTVNLAARPSSPVTLAIVEPANGQMITGGILHIAVSVTGGTVVKETSTHIEPTKGHVHVYLNDQLVRMNYTLVQDFPVKKGLYSLRAEFVGSDHFPFNPRVYSEAIVIQVQ